MNHSTNNDSTRVKSISPIYSNEPFPEINPERVRDDQKERRLRTERGPREKQGGPHEPTVRCYDARDSGNNSMCLLQTGAPILTKCSASSLTVVVYGISWREIRSTGGLVDGSVVCGLWTTLRLWPMQDVGATSGLFFLVSNDPICFFVEDIFGNKGK